MRPASRSSSGGSLTTSRPPAPAASPAHRAVIAGAAKLRAVTTSNECGAPSASTAHIVGDHRHTIADAECRDRPAEQIGPGVPPLDQGDLQVRATHGDHQPGKATARAQIDQGRAVSGIMPNELFGVGDGARSSDASPIAPRAWMAAQRRDQRVVVSHSPGR